MSSINILKCVTGSIMILIAHQIEWTNRNISIKHPSHKGQNWKLVHLTSPLICWINTWNDLINALFQSFDEKLHILFNNKSNSLAILFGKRMLFLLLAHIVIKIWNADNYQSFDTPNPPTLPPSTPAWFMKWSPI